MDWFSVLSQNIHILESEHYRRFVCSRGKSFVILVKALERLFALLNKSFMCFIKKSLRSMAIPSSFVSLVLFICTFSTINVKLLLFINYARELFEILRHYPPY